MNKDISALDVYRRLLRFSKLFWPYLLLGMVGAIGMSAVDGRLTTLIKPIINYSFDYKAHLEFLKWLPVQVILFVIFRLACGFLSAYYIGKMSRSVVMKFRQSIFSHLFDLPISYYDRRSDGAILSTIIYNVDQVAQASSDVLLTVLREGLLAIVLVGIMVYENWRVTLLFLLLVPIIYFVLGFFNRKIRALSVAVQSTMADVTSTAEEGIKGLKVIKMYQGRHHEEKRMHAALAENRSLELQIITRNSISSAAVQLVLALPLIAVLSPYIRPYFHLSIGGFVLLVTAMLQLPRPARRLSVVNALIQKGVAAAKSIFELLDEPAEPSGPVSCEKPLSGDIQFHHVRFSYPASDQLVLQNIDLHIRAGETIGIVGCSGSGKSTLIALLVGFYKNYSGEILLDGIDMRRLAVDSLRQNMAMVSQQTILFNNSIRNNIAYAMPQASDADIHRVAQMAYIANFIDSLPKGYDTVVGDNGVLLSGGQRQRIAIARALLKNAPIVIFDEATASLDVYSESQIQLAFDELSVGRTTIVIAHRLTTIEKSDRLIVIDKGRIVEVGTHASLIVKNGFYSALYRTQLVSVDEMEK